MRLFVAWFGILLPLLIAALALLIFGNDVRADNPTSIVQPYSGPDPGYILAESSSGLANRLRVLAAYMYIAESKYDGAHLVFVWDKNHACPGHFLSIFEPIDTVVFATNNSRYVLDKNAKIVYEDSFAVFYWIMQMNDIPRNLFGSSWGEIRYRMYSRYFPVKEVMLKVAQFVNAHNMCNASAMHLRTTDLDKRMPERRRAHLPSYFQFVESRPAGEKVFLMTDSPATQQRFLRKFGRERVLVYSDIADEALQSPSLVMHSSSFPALHDHTSLSQQQQQQRMQRRQQHQLVEEHRFTPLEHTLIDVIIAAHAKEFKPSPFSSLSELVHMFEQIGKRDRGWCAPPSHDAP